MSELQVKSSNLTPAQKKFADEYLISLNGARAYRSAFRKNDLHADGNAAKLMSIPAVKEYIAAKLQKINEVLDLKAIDVIAEVRDLAFSKITDYLSFDEHGVKFKNSADIDCRAIAEVSSKRTITRVGKVETEVVDLKLKLHSKDKSLELLTKYMKLIGEKDRGGGDKRPTIVYIPNFTNVGQQIVEKQITLNGAKALPEGKNGTARK